MESFEAKLGRILRKHFPGSVVELEPFEPRPMMGGFVIWSGFKDVELRERVREVWRVMQEELDDRELAKVGLIYPLTRREMMRRQEEQEQDAAELGNSLAGS